MKANNLYNSLPACFGRHFPSVFQKQKDTIFPVSDTEIKAASCRELSQKAKSSGCGLGFHAWHHTRLPDLEGVSLFFLSSTVLRVGLKEKPILGILGVGLKEKKPILGGPYHIWRHIRARSGSLSTVGSCLFPFRTQFGCLFGGSPLCRQPRIL